MKKVLSILLFATPFFYGNAQTNVADARTYGIGQTVTVTLVATNGSELGNIRYGQDNSAGIAIYGNSISSVNRWDSITVTGQLSDFSGLLEISPITSITNHGQAITPPSPIQLTIPVIGESLESQLIELPNVTFVQTGNFATGNSTVQVTDGTNTIDVRINGSTNIAGTAIPTGPITLTGLVGQFNANYQIVPRDLNDIVPYVAPTKEINVLIGGTTYLNNTNYFIGNTPQVTLEIENLGTQDLTVSGISFTGPNASAFSTTYTGGTIAGGTSQTFQVDFNPTTTGTQIAAIEIANDDADENPYIINFEGVGTDNIATEPTSNPSNLTFPILEAYTLGGQYNAGTGASQYIVLWSNGSPVTGVPSDGSTYKRGDIIGNAKVAYIGSGTSFTPRGVIANQNYYFAVYAFNGSNGFENYLTSSPAVGNVTSLGSNIGTYYSGISTSSPTFITDLRNLIDNHNVISYFMYKNTMMNEFEVRDTTNGQSYVICAYTGERKVFDDPFDWSATGYSREHTWAHTWMPTYPADNPELPEYSDQHNLYPTNLSQANSPRSNLPLGEVTGSTVFSYLDGKVGYDNNGQLVYEPRNEHKGNAARSIFYMSVRYGFGLNETTPSSAQDLDVLRAWHFNDLPDNYEIARHEYIYNLQGNRNPFIDSVNYACFIDFTDESYLAGGTGCNTASIEEVLLKNLVIFPIPAKETVYIQINKELIKGYRIYDIQGTLIMKESGIQNKVLELDVEHLNSGTYIIEVDTEKGSVREKLVIQ